MPHPSNSKSINRLICFMICCYITTLAYTLKLKGECSLFKKKKIYG